MSAFIAALLPFSNPNICRAISVHNSAKSKEKFAKWEKFATYKVVQKMKVKWYYVEPLFVSKGLE